MSEKNNKTAKTPKPKFHPLKEIVMDTSQVTGFRTIVGHFSETEKWLKKQRFKENPYITRFLNEHSPAQIRKYRDLHIDEKGQLLAEGIGNAKTRWKIEYISDYLTGINYLTDYDEIVAYTQPEAPLILIFDEGIIVAIAPRIDMDGGKNGQ